MEYRDLQYEQLNIGYDCQYPEGGIKCKNYALCKNILSPDWFSMKSNYICTNCDIFRWRKLEFKENTLTHLHP